MGGRWLKESAKSGELVEGDAVSQEHQGRYSNLFRSISVPHDSISFDL